MVLLKVSGVSKEGILNDITFTQQKFQKIAVVGETGSGKTTLLKIIAGLAQPDKGEVLFEKEKVAGPQEQLVPGHSGIAYLSQQFELQKFLRVEQVLAYANRLSDGEAQTLFEICQIDHLLSRKTDQLSGGEKQRIAMARLLISSPKLLLLDEPFTHLDMVHKNTLKSVIYDISAKLKISCILVSHDPQDTLSWADKILVMKEGAIVQQGRPEKIYHEPVSEYVAGLFGKYNLLHGDQSKTFLKARQNNRNGKAMLVRPESFRLVAKRDKGVRGKVTHVNFFGSYYEVEVSVDGMRLTVKTETGNVNNGSVVYVSLSSKHVCWI